MFIEKTFNVRCGGSALFKVAKQLVTFGWGCSGQRESGE